MLHIGVIPGDGIGPEVVGQALRVLAQVATMVDFTYRLVRYPFGTTHYLEDGVLVSEADLTDMRNLDGVLMGALGDRRVDYGILEHRIMSTLIAELRLGTSVQYVSLAKESLCPIKDKKPADVNFVVVKQNSLDVAEGNSSTIRKGKPDELAITHTALIRRDVEDTVRYAYGVARERPRHHLTSICGSAAIPVYDLWRRVGNEVARDFPDVKTAIIDKNQAINWMLNNPEWYDVIVSPNVVGETLMSLGSQLQGGVGFGAVGYVNPNAVSLFSPVHGPATRLRGTGMANPIGAIMALSLLLKSVGQEVAANIVADAVRTVIARCEDEVFSEGSMCTGVIGDLILRELGHRRNVVY